MAKPNCLFITPAVPDPTGTGLSIRAHQVLEALASSYDVYLLVTFERFRKDWSSMEGLMRCRGVALLPAQYWRYPWLFLLKKFRIWRPLDYYRWCPRPWELEHLPASRLRSLSRIFGNIRFDLVHVFRLYSLPVHQAFPYSVRPSHVQMDLDDVESITRRRLSELFRLNGQRRMATLMDVEAGLYEAIEQHAFAAVDRIFICSQADRERLMQAYGCENVEVLPNVIALPVVEERASEPAPFTFLFVGALHYYPNQDALLHFCREILPTLRHIAGQQFRVQIVGVGAPRAIRRELAGIEEIDFVGGVANVTPYYQASDAIIVPIRAGGGTRIKILEAFAHRRPVVSTVSGAEGITAVPDRHFLESDTPEGFAHHCATLMKDPALRKQLIENAFELVVTKYTGERMKQVLCRDAR